ncbi:unnamed protein product, partial [Staurois parvus]
MGGGGGVRRAQNWDQEGTVHGGQGRFCNTAQAIQVQLSEKRDCPSKSRTVDKYVMQDYHGAPMHLGSAQECSCIGSPGLR